MKKKIQEGNATIEIDEAKIVSKELEAFYNPKMSLNRDLSIALLKSLNEKELTIGLPLAGTGVRAVRMLLEMGNQIRELWINDIDDKAIKYVNNNLKLNNLEKDKRIIINNKEANIFLSQSKGFDYIDIDPFGSPNFLLDTSTKFISRRGILAVTATDTSALAGTYPNACKRKYFATSAICPQKHELGMRILTRKVQLMGLHNERSLEPIFSYHHEHYYRIFFKVKKSKDKAAKLFEKLSTYHYYCNKCSNNFSDKNHIEFCPECKNELIEIGPLYDGLMQDEKTIKKLLKDESLSNEAKKILKNIEEELPLQNIIGCYDTHNVCYNHKFKTQSLKDTKEKISKKGYNTVTCSTNRVAIKTTAPHKEVIKALKN